MEILEILWLYYLNLRGSPENLRTVVDGSLMVTISDREGNTLYVRKTGYSSTGWREVQTINPNNIANSQASAAIGYQFFTQH